MKLYYKKGACSLAVRILLHELNLPCDYIAVDLAAKKTEGGDNFYAINPKGVIPTLVLDDGTVLTEGAVIQQYLAETYKADQLLPPLGNIQRYQILQWLNYCATELHKGYGPFFNAKLPAEIKQAIFLPMLEAKLKFLNQHLEHSKFIAGPNITLPDFYIFTVLSWSPAIGIDLTKFAQVQRYFNDIKARPAVQKSLKEEGLI